MASATPPPFGASSPFLPTTVHGDQDPTHTLNAGIVWSPATIPTPWPFLIVSFGLSFITALWGFTSNRWPVSVGSFIGKLAEPLQRKWPTLQSFLNVTLLAICTMRAVAALYAAVKAFVSNSAKWAPPSALAMLIVAIIPYILDRG